MFRKILYPTDFSAVAGKALEYVKKTEGSGNERSCYSACYREQ